MILNASGWAGGRKGKVRVMAVLLVSAFLIGLSSMEAWAASPQETGSLVGAAAEAMGGLEALRAIKTQVVVGRGQSFEPEQTPAPGEEPRHVSDFRYTLTHDFSSSRLRLEWQRETLYPFSNTWQYTEVINGESGFIDGADGFRSKPRAPLVPARITTRRKQEKLSSPLLLLRAAAEHPEAVQRQADEQFKGKLHSVIALTGSGQPIRILLDAETRLPAKVETLEDDPIYGDTSYEVVFADWRQVGGVRLPFELTYRVNGRVIRTEQREEIRTNAELPADAFAIPTGLRQPADPDDALRGERASQWFLRRIALGSPLDEDQSRSVVFTEVAPGVHHVTGGTHHSLLIEMEDYLMVVEAPLYEERSQAVIAETKKRRPAKPIRYVVNTHFHNDHSGGLRAYAAAGTVVVTGAVNKEHFEKVFHAPHTVHPDALQKHPREVVIEAVSEKKILSDGGRRVEIYPVENSHAKGMLVVYLPQEKILFVSDLFTPGMQRPGGVWAKELLAAITQEGLQVERIAGGHGGVGSIEDLRRATGQEK